MKIKLILLLLILNVPVLAGEFKLVGTYLLEYSIFKIDVYQISYFRGEGEEKIVLDYKNNVAKKHSLEGWKIGLKDKLQDEIYVSKAQWLYDHTQDMAKGDTLSFVKKDSTLEIKKNNTLIARTSDPLILELVFEPWLGKKPVEEKMKSVLLGQGGS